MADSPLIVKLSSNIAYSNNECDDPKKVHGGNVKAVQSLYTCDMCSIGFTEENLYENHMYYHSVKREDKGIIVKSVDDLFPKSKDEKLDDEITEITILLPPITNSTEIIIPDKLDDNLTEKQRLALFGKRTILPKPPPSYPCQKCSKALPSETELADHMKERCESLPLVCNICDKRFKQNSLLVRHYKGHKRDGKYFCELCNRIFSRTGNLRSHFLNVHLSDKPHPCLTCGKKFRSNMSLITHLQSHVEDKPYVCHICERPFRQMSMLRQHMWYHSSRKQYACGMCDESFSHKNRLEEHYLLHTGEIPFPCDSCDRVFAQQKNLLIHKRSHRRKSFLCDTCNKSFTTKNILQQHLLCHEEINPFFCEQCGKQCANKAGLTQHLRTHSLGKPYACDICSKTFTQKSTLKSHMIVHDSKCSLEDEFVDLEMLQPLIDTVSDDIDVALVDL